MGRLVAHTAQFQGLLLSQSYGWNSFLISIVSHCWCAVLIQVDRYDGMLGAPQYTRPDEFRGMAVPEVLKNGNHAAIARGRRKEALRATQARRPDLLKSSSPEDRALLAELNEESDGAGQETGPEARR